MIWISIKESKEDEKTISFLAYLVYNITGKEDALLDVIKLLFMLLLFIKSSSTFSSSINLDDKYLTFGALDPDTDYAIKLYGCTIAGTKSLPYEYKITTVPEDTMR